jgi:energy-converting hydrogenase Eha subunit F
MATLPGKLLRHPQDLVIIEFILSSPILFTAGIYFPRILLHNQGYPKVCPDSLNLSNAGNSFAGISSLTPINCFPGPGT